MSEGLAALERWMQALVTHPEGPEAGAEASARSGGLAAEIEHEFQPSATLSALERVQLYSGMYFARLVEVLEEEFPALVAWLGRAPAQALFRAYVVAHPSRSFTLNRLGRGLEAFLRDEAVLARELADRRRVAVELARLERCIQDVFDAPEGPSLAPEALSAVPAQRFGDLRLVPHAACALLDFAHPLEAGYRAFREGQAWPPLEPRPCALAVFRQAGRVWRLELTPPQRALLGALFEGLPLGAALERLAHGGHDLAALAPELQGWFRTWAAEGFFAGFELVES